jgi:hypothetical protein
MAVVLHPGEDALNFHRRRYRSRAHPSHIRCLGVTRFHRDAVTTHLFIKRIGIVCLDAGQSLGSSSRKHTTRTASTSLHPASEALSTDTARGRPSPEAITTIFATTSFRHWRRHRPRAPRFRPSVTASAGRCWSITTMFGWMPSDRLWIRCGGTVGALGGSSEISAGHPQNPHKMKNGSEVASVNS